MKRVAIQSGLLATALMAVGGMYAKPPNANRRDEYSPDKSHDSKRDWSRPNKADIARMEAAAAKRARRNAKRAAQGGK